MAAVVGDGTVSTVADNGPDVGDGVDAIFDPSANVVKQSLANHGWTVGAVITPRKAESKTPRADEQWEISHVNDDGTIGLFPLFPDGSVNKAKVVMTDQVQLQKTFKAVDASARLSKWDLSNAVATVGPDFWMSTANQAMFASSLLHRNCPGGSVYVQKTPTVKVIVAKAPSTPFVFTAYPAVAKKSAKVEPGHIHAVVETDAPITFDVDKPNLDSSLQLHEFWRMRHSSDKQKANMHISMVDVMCPLPKAKGLPKSVSVKVPTAVAFTKVAPGDELVLYVPAKEKAKTDVDKLLPVRIAPVAKKQRTEP